MTIAKDAWGGKAKRHDHEVSGLKAKVKRGEISALEAIAGPIINTIRLNKPKRKPAPEIPPEQIDMRSLWSEAQ